MGQQRSCSGRRRNSSFDIRNFSFMKRSTNTLQDKCQRHSSGKSLEQNRFKLHPVIHRDPLTVRPKQERKSIDSEPAWLRGSYDKKRNRRASQPMRDGVSTKVVDSWRKVSQWPTQKLCSSENKSDHSLSKQLQLKKEKGQRKYVDKSCSPILQLVARHHNVCTNGRKLKKTGQCNSSNDGHRLLQKIEELVTASSSSTQTLSHGGRSQVRPSPQIHTKSDEAGRNVTKCENCGMMVEPNFSNGVGAITKQAVENVCKKHPYLVDVADSVGSFIHVSTPIVDIIRTQIVPAMLDKSLKTENTFQHASVDTDGRLLSSANVKYSENTSAADTIKARRTFPFGVLRKKVSSKNPMKGLHPLPNPVVKPPPYEWVVSPLPNTSGFGPRGGTKSSQTPVTNSPPFTPSEIQPPTMPIEVESAPRSSIVPNVVEHTETLEYKNASDKCTEWYKKCIEDETRNTKQERRTGKCAEWYEKIADTVEDNSRENTDDVALNAGKFSQSKAAEKRMMRESKIPSASTKQENKEGEERYSNQKSSPLRTSIPVTSAQHRTKYREVRIDDRKHSSEKQSLEAQNEKLMNIQSPRSARRSENLTLPESPTRAEGIQDFSEPSAPVASPSTQVRASTTKTSQALIPLTTRFATKSWTKHSPVVTKRPEDGENIITEIQQKSSFRFKPARDFTSKRRYEVYSRGDPRRRVSSLIGRRLATETPSAMTKSVPPTDESGLLSQSAIARTHISRTGPLRIRKTAPTKVIPESYCRVSMRRDARNQIRMYKAKNGIVHSLNPFLWFRRTHEKIRDGQHSLTSNTTMPLVSTVPSRPIEAIVCYSRPQWSRLRAISPSVVRTWSMMSSSNELKPILQTVEGGVGDLICPESKLNDRKMSARRTTTRAQMFRSQFIQKKIRLVSDYNDSWWKNFNSKSLPVSMNAKAD